MRKWKKWVKDPQLGHEDVLTGDVEIQMCFVLTTAGPELDLLCPPFHTHPEAWGKFGLFFRIYVS